MYTLLVGLDGVRACGSRSIMSLLMVHEVECESAAAISPNPFTRGGVAGCGIRGMCFALQPGKLE